MNQRLDGWKLALAVTIAAAAIAAVAWIALDLLSDNTQEQTLTDGATLTPTATPLPVTEPVANPTPPLVPTPVEVPTLAATPTTLPTAEPAPTAVRAATATTVPSSTAAQPTSGPVATPTVEPDLITVTCSSQSPLPETLGVGETLPELTALVTPEEAADNMSFVWALDNTRTVGAPNTGTIRYDVAGTYTIKLTATDVTNAQSWTTTCGTVKVAATTESIEASCAVKPALAGRNLDEVTINDPMKVTVTWTPSDVLLDLQYEFETHDKIVFSNQANSGDSKIHTFTNRSSVFKILWRNPDTGENTRLSCAAFPVDQAAPTPTAGPTSAASPTPTATPTATSTPT